MSASLSGIGAKKGADIPPVGSDENGQVDATNSGKGVALPGLATALGTITAGAPQALGASGDQKGTSSSAIADGAILITSGDAASQEVADSISRDTEAANGGALTQEFDEARRAEIQEGFAVTKELIAQTSIFFANRAAEEEAKRDKAKQLEQQAEQNEALAANGSYKNDNDEVIILTEGQISNLRMSAAQSRDEATLLNAEADEINARFGAGSPARIIATAINGAAGGNAAGSVGDLVRASAANVLQSLAATEIKTLVDGIKGDSRTKETTRAALQAVVGCAGSAAGGGDCGSAAAGAAGSVVTNYLLTEFLDPREKDPVTGEDKPLSLEEQQARTNLVATIIGAIAEGAGLDTAAATTAAQIETENNDQVETENGTTIICGEGTDLVCTGKAIFISDYEQQPRNTIAYKNFADAAKQLDFDPANLTEDQRAIVNNVLAAHVFNEIPFKVFDNPEKTDALIAARKLVLDARTNKPELYNQLLQEAGGNEVLAIYRAAVQDYYSDKPGEYGKDLTLGYLDPRDVLASIAGTGVGTGGKIIDDIGDLIGVILNPIDSTKQAIEAVKVILENPDQVIEQLGEEGEKYIDAVIGSYIGANDARALGDEGQVYEAQKQLGELVGAVVV